MAEFELSSDTWPFAEHWSFSAQTVCCCKQKTKHSLGWTGPRSEHNERFVERLLYWTTVHSERSLNGSKQIRVFKGQTCFAPPRSRRLMSEKRFWAFKKKCAEAKTFTEHWLQLLLSFSKLWICRQETSQVEAKVNTIANKDGSAHYPTDISLWCATLWLRPAPASASGHSIPTIAWWS